MIVKAIMKLRPGAQWALRGDTYEGLEWLDEVQTKPSEQEINAAILEVEAEIASTEYQRKRKVEYPEIGDQLDALWKGGQALEDMKQQIMAVKAKYPKE